ncbi:ATP-binding protein [Desulfuromonas sp. AOP6]|uniref:two-component system sensor histidine kinase NtrB n=1 Tax=Desulfuromonas sp. AOP6 TaxID=1566351 RepID=UPI001271532A|nr:ATP-binding protein [Desulfuromonas sp. AOP6]BCA80328.1 PAS domain-containing sensor histidine kinase [Desulfuromonas sp. AOP6]
MGRDLRPPEDLQLYLRILESIDRGVIAINRRERISFINPAAQAFVGLSERQGLGRHYEQIFTGQRGVIRLIQTAMREGRSISDHENIFLSRPGMPSLPVSLSCAPIFTPQGEQDGAVLILRDLSRVRELEDAVRQTDRLGMLSTLAAGLAHEIKNPLGGIKGASQLLIMELPGDSPLQEYARIMNREAERINRIIEELMDLTCPRLPVLEEVNLAQVIGDIVIFQQEAQREKSLDIVLRLDPSIPPIMGDHDLLTQLFLNLIKNAAEAIDEKGRIEITTRVASDFHLTQSGKKPVPLIVVEVTDNGKGIAPDLIDKVFTPFFTTKTKGTGLGLATCQKIVRQHQGFLKVVSTAGQGTTFIVSLPFIRQSKERDEAAKDLN